MDSASIPVSSLTLVKSVPPIKTSTKISTPASGNSGWISNTFGSIFGRSSSTVMTMLHSICSSGSLTPPITFVLGLSDSEELDSDYEPSLTSTAIGGDIISSDDNESYESEEGGEIIDVL